MPSELELNDDMTTDEIKAYAESVAQEIAAERSGEDKKSDAEIINDVASIESTPVEKKSDSSAEAESQSEETGEKPSGPKWFDDDVEAEATAYGISKSELEDFTSREEFERALRLIDKAALESGRKALAAESEESPRNEKGQFSKKDDAKSASSEALQPKDGRYEVSLSTELYDDEIVGEFTRMRDHYESRIAALEAHFSESAVRAEEQRFDSFVDKLGHSDLFGKTGSESKEELDRRRDLHVAVKAQIIGLQKLGRQADLTDQLVERVANMVFSEQLGKKRLKQHTHKISKQSQLRQGGSPTKPQPVRDNPRDEFDRLFKELSNQ